MKIVSAPTYGSKCAAAAITTNAPDSSVLGDASMVDMDSFNYSWENNGADVWFRMQVLFPSGANPSYPGKFTLNPAGSGWNMFMTWHNPPCSSCPGSYLSPFVGVRNNGNGSGSFLFRLVGGDAMNPSFLYLNGPAMSYDHWYDVLVHIKWSPDPSIGYAEWFVDGQRVSGALFPTLYRMPDGRISGVLFQGGHYRGTVSWTDTLYIDGVKVGPTQSSVQ
jgi:hypothetical protein